MKKSVDAYISRAGKLMEIKKYESAISILKRAITEYPQTAVLYSMLADTYNRLDDTTAATEAFKSALEVDPNHLNANIVAGIVMRKRKNLTAAVDYLTNALEIDPESSLAYLCLGDVYWEQSACDLCISYYGQAVRLDRTSSEARARLGNALIKQYLSRYDDAV